MRSTTVEETRSMSGTANPALVRVTPEQATQWLETMQYAHQRAVRQWHVDFLADEMRRERFIQGTQIRFASLNGQRMLVDGQHRLWAVVVSEIPQLFSVLTTRVESKEEAAWIYVNTDIGLKRSNSEALGILELDRELQITKTEARVFNGATNFMATGCMRNTGRTDTLHRDDAVRYMRLYVPFAREYFTLIAECEKRSRHSAMRAATLSIALLSLRFSVPRAESRGDPSVQEFWRGAVFDDGVQIGDPRKVANRHLLNASMSGGGSPTKSSIVSPPFSSRYLVNCFNAYMTRRELTFTRVVDNRSPLNMYGVPNDSTQWMS